MIRKRAYILAILDPSRSANKNWIRAEKELTEPLPWSSFVRWLGFSEKKGWDWLDFLIRLSIPVVVAAGGWYLSGENAKQQQRINKLNQQDLIVSEYVTNMQQLVLEKQLQKLQSREPVAVIARALTLTSLSRLRTESLGELSEHKGQILQFLYEAGLIYQNSKKYKTTNNVSLIYANLIAADLDFLYLEGANLVAARLSRASLNPAYLMGIDLTSAKLDGADLRRAFLKGANLSKSDLRKALLTNAILEYANLTHAKLQGADLSRAILEGANFSNVQWDKETIWPVRSRFVKTKNIPKELKMQLGL